MRKFAIKRKAKIGVVVGALIAMLGLAVALQSSSLATHWQALGEGAWGGTTDPAQEHTYRAAGLTILTVGLFFSSLCGYLWISEPSDPARAKEEG